MTSETLKRFLPIYFIAFLFAFHVSLPLYINSSFLETFVPEVEVGIIYAVASFGTLVFLAFFPNVLTRFGNVKTSLTVLAIQAALLIALALSSSSAVILTMFVLAQMFIMLGMFTIDVFLERFSKDETTGFARGALLTVVNTAILLGPFSAGLILTNGDFFKVYLAASALLIPAFFIVLFKFSDFKDSLYKRTPFWSTLKTVLLKRHPRDPILHAVIANFFLQFFFSWMVIYTPIYLSERIGFSWQEIGIIFGIMLLPFVLFGIPVGRLVDTKVQEKWVIGAGFAIMALFTAALFFVKSSELFLWALLLFGSRVGATFVETATESYFWKHVKSSDTEILSVFRDSQPLALLVGPAIATFLFAFFDVRYLFLILPLFLLVGAINALRMAKTKSAP